MTQNPFGGFRGGGGLGGQPTIRFGPQMTPVIKSFLIACGAAFLLQIFFPALFPFFALIPERLFSGWIWQLVTFNLMHGSIMHLVLNGFMIWMFGGELELKLGRRRMILLMAISGIGAGLCQSLVMGSSPVPIIGASGIVFGLLLVYGTTWPNRTVLVMFIIPMKVKWMVVIFGVIEFMSFVGNAQPGVAHLAHLGGMIFAYLFIRWDKIYMDLRKVYYSRKLEGYRKKYRVHQGGKDDDRRGSTIH